MKVNIVNQTNEQECGICVLTSLHNYFYKENITKESVLDQSNITSDGMTIFDFETLGLKLGIESESYEITFSEFKNLKINNYFVLLISAHETTNHYVIARKRSKYIEIYDSCLLEVKKVTYEQLEKIFLNVFILVKKKPNETYSKVFGRARTLLMFDLKFVLLNLGLSILLLAMSVAAASFLNFVFDMVIAKSSINNLITICFIFVLIYFSSDILNYISNLYMSKQIKNYFILFTSKILSSFETKKLNFLNKVDKNWIFKIDECVYNIANFTINEINKFISNIIFCIVCICIIGSLQYYLLIFAVLFAIIEVIFFLFSYKKKKQVFIQIIKSENNNVQFYKHLINYMNYELWNRKRESIIHRIKKNYSNIYKNYSDVILFRNNTNLFKSLLKSLFDICLVGTMSYFIIKMNQLSIGKLTFLISTFALYKNSVNELCNYFLSKMEFDIYWQVYKDLTFVSNVKISKQSQFDKTIKSIKFCLENNEINLDSKKFNIVNLSAMELINQSKTIKINGKTLDENCVLKKMIIFDQNSSCSTELLLKNIQSNPEEYSQYLRYFDLNLNWENQSFYDGLIINYLNLLSEQNKIILIDSIMHFIKEKDLLVIKQILNKIKKHNFVFFIGKEEND